MSESNACPEFRRTHTSRLLTRAFNQNAHSMVIRSGIDRTWPLCCCCCCQPRRGERLYFFESPPRAAGLDTPPTFGSLSLSVASTPRLGRPSAGRTVITTTTTTTMLTAARTIPNECVCVCAGFIIKCAQGRAGRGWHNLFKPPLDFASVEQLITEEGLFGRALLAAPRRARHRFQQLTLSSSASYHTSHTRRTQRPAAGRTDDRQTRSAPPGLPLIPCVSAAHGPRLVSSRLGGAFDQPNQSNQPIDRSRAWLGFDERGWALWGVECLATLLIPPALHATHSKGSDKACRCRR
jgi:hypothetical protein